MISNSYDKDITTISPDGEILQLKYALKASNRGNMILGISTEFHTFLVSCCDEATKNKDCNNNILSISENFGILVSGVIGDSKYIHKYLEKNKTEYEEAFGRPYLLSSVIHDTSKIFSQTIFNSKNRPFGVNLILGGYDCAGPTIFCILPNCKIEKKNRILMGSIKKVEILLLDKNFSNIDVKKQKFSIDEMLECLIETIKKSFTKEDYLTFIKNNLNVSLVGKKTQWLIIENIFFRRFVNFGKNFVDQNIGGKDLINIFKKKFLLNNCTSNNKRKKKATRTLFFFLKIQICFIQKI